MRCGTQRRQTEAPSNNRKQEKENMETTELRIITDTEPEIIDQTTLDADVPSPINDLVAVAVPVRHSRHLDVDDVLARSLPKLTERLEKAA